MLKLKFLFILTLFIYNFSNGQINFRKDFEQANPAPKSSFADLEEREKMFLDYIDKAIIEENDTHELYGNLHLFFHQIHEHDYIQAATYLLNAEKIANTSENIGWQGWVSYQRGVLNMELRNNEEALTAYQLGAKLCLQAGDSLCYGENLEQIAAINSISDNFEEAKRNFEEAIPLIEKFGNEKLLITAYINYGTRLSREGKFPEAISALNRAIDLANEKKRYGSVARGLNNLAGVYYRSGRDELAINTLRKCIQFNKEHNLSDNLIKNYLGLYSIYKAQGNYKDALASIDTHTHIKDSLVGAETQREIAILESKFKTAEKELALEKSQKELALANRSIERGVAVLIAVLLLVSFGLWNWHLQRKQTKEELAKNQENLENMTQILLNKNTQLSNLQMEIMALEQEKTTASEIAKEEKDEDEDDDFEKNLYNQRILTNDDWAAFKVYFDKSYPGYLLQLRTIHPTLTEAEERLFLFIKLNLTRKEAAAILGISADSVKKTRNRLRKRLDLEQEISLDVYIKNFEKKEKASVI